MDDKPKIIIVAGGLATRMKPITEQIPKCLVDINGKPLIEHQIEYFKKKGYKSFIFCVAHLAEKVRAYFDDGSKFGVNINYVQETEQLMGTAGSVKLVEGIIGDDENFIVYYGDNLTNMDFDKMIKFHEEKKALVTICIRPLPDKYKSSSIITLDNDKRITVFFEKPALDTIEKYAGEQKYINSGIYVMNKKVLQLTPKNQKYDFAKELFPLLIEKDMGIYGYETTEFFREIGRVEKYESFLKEVRGKTNIFENE
jgi:mannose-1-phosphate guanylyltransferase/phosphomannomutase